MNATQTKTMQAKPGIVYVVVGVVQKTRPPLIAVERDLGKARRRAVDGRVYAVADACDAILKGEPGMTFDDRDYIYDQLHAIVRGVPSHTETDFELAAGF